MLSDKNTGDKENRFCFSSVLTNLYHSNHSYKKNAKYLS